MGKLFSLAIELLQICLFQITFQIFNPFLRHSGPAITVGRSSQSTAFKLPFCILTILISKCDPSTLCRSQSLLLSGANFCLQLLIYLIELSVCCLELLTRTDIHVSSGLRIFAVRLLGDLYGNVAGFAGKQKSGCQQKQTCRKFYANTAIFQLVSPFFNL